MKPYFVGVTLPPRARASALCVNPGLCVNVVVDSFLSSAGRAAEGEGGLSPDDGVLQGSLENSEALKALLSLFEH